MNPRRLLPILLLTATGCGFLTRKPCEDAETIAFITNVEAITADAVTYYNADVTLTQAQATIKLARAAEILDRCEIVKTRGQEAAK